MKNILFTTAVALLLYSCQKQASTGTPQSYLSTVEAVLKDSLSTEDYASLDFNHALRTDIDSAHLHFLRVPISGQNITAHFLLVKTDLQGHVMRGRFITVTRDASRRVTFTGSITYHSMKGTVVKAAAFVDGKLQKAAGSNVSSMMEDPDPVVDGGDLTPVIVTYTPSGGGFTYADWYNLVQMAGDDGVDDGGYYSPASGGGGGGNGSAPAEQIDFDYPENKDAIDVKKYLNCYGSVQDPSADYTITICADLPVDADPSRFFNWSDASPGHTFVELYKNGTGGLVQQNLGFYPNSSWKTVVGPDNIASKIADDAGHEYQAKYTIAVTASQFQQALNAAAKYSTHDYNVAEFNCADYALQIFRAAGGNLNVPQFQIPGFPSNDGSNTPEGVYDAIAKLVLAGNKTATANGQKQWVGDSHGACD